MTCPWCGGSNIQHNTKQVATAPYLAVELGTAKIPMAALSTYSECECGLIFQENRQSDEWYDWYYSSGAYRKTLGISQEDMDKDEQARAIDLVLWLTRLKIDINYLVDFGSSRGYFTQEVKNTYHCFTTGIDINLDYAIYKSLALYNGKQPDIVSSIHVLEHTTDPLKELTRYAELTSKYLLIEVPGLHTLGGALRFAHLYYFPTKLLREKIEKLGFSIIAIESEPNTRILAEKVRLPFLRNCTKRISV
jgi:hypothetical protein